MPEHTQHNEHGRRDNRRDNHHRSNDERRNDRERREASEDGDDRTNEEEARPQNPSRESSPGMNELHQAMNAVLNEVQGVKQNVTEIRSELNTTQGAVLELKDKVEKPAEVKKEETEQVEAPKQTEAIKPKPTEPVTVTAVAPVKSKSFLETVGDGIKKIGEIPGKVVRAGVGLVLSPFIVAGKILEGFWNGLTKPLFPKKT